MMNTLRFLPLLLVLLVVGCGDQAKPDERESEKEVKPQSRIETTKSEVSGEADLVKPKTKPESMSVWFEPLLSVGGTPTVAVDFLPSPDGKQFFILGRNGGLHLISQRFEDYPFGPKTTAVKVSKYDKKSVAKVQIDGTYAKGDLGAMALALDPKFEDNGFLYVWYADKEDTATHLDRFKWSTRQEDFEASRTNIITVSRQDPPAPYHAGGILKFLPDGTLLISPGDAERPELAQDPTTLNGKIIRIIPHTDADGGYDIPSDNPKFEGIEHRPEIVAMGLRAVFRGFLNDNGHLIFGDVGSAREEVNVWTRGAENFGWGLFDYSDGPDNMPEGIVKPLVWWDKKDDYSKDDPDYSGETRLSAGVGLVYKKTDASKDRYAGMLDNHLVFFDIMRGWIRSGPWNDKAATIGEHKHLGHLSFISQMRQGEDGYIYVLTWGGNPTLFRMRPDWDSAVH